MGSEELDPTLAFIVEQPQPGIEVRVNFGLLAGRNATPAELDRLAEWLLDEVEEVSIIAEERHEIDAHAEASVHQVRIQAESGDAYRILERAEHWAHLCVADRHAEVADGV